MIPTILLPGKGKHNRSETIGIVYQPFPNIIKHVLHLFQERILGTDFLPRVAHEYLSKLINEEPCFEVLHRRAEKSPITRTMGAWYG